MSPRVRRSSKLSQKRRKSDGNVPKKTMEIYLKTHANYDPEWVSKSIQNQSKTYPKSMFFYGPVPKRVFCGIGPPGGAQKSPYYFFRAAFGVPLAFKVAPGEPKYEQIKVQKRTKKTAVISQKKLCGPQPFHRG